MRIRLLGGLEAIDGTGAPVRFSTRKAALLFAALVLAGGRGHRREALAEAFWPGRKEAQARNSLRQALANIRRNFRQDESGSSIRVSNDLETIALTGAPDHADVWTFERACTNGKSAVAAELYTGDLL
ncbi:MAG: hypothetical protein MUE79_03490, partial [Nitratireductor sp.]|nr:hypothetical protein [Nitratireductor sp.]